MDPLENAPEWAKQLSKAIDEAYSTPISEIVAKKLEDLPKEVYATKALPTSRDQIDAWCKEVRQQHQKDIDNIVDEIFPGPRSEKEHKNPEQTLIDDVLNDIM